MSKASSKCVVSAMLLCIPFLAAPSLAQWERVWGPAETVVIDGETGAVYAVTAINLRMRRGATGATAPLGRIFQWDGKPDVWTDLGKTGKKFVTAGWKPSSGLFCLDAEGKVSRYSGQPGTWEG